MSTIEAIEVFLEVVVGVNSKECRVVVVCRMNDHSQPFRSVRELRFRGEIDLIFDQFSFALVDRSAIGECRFLVSLLCPRLVERDLRGG